MKFIIVGLLFAAVVADRLENTYLPPSNARTAGGNGDILTGPSTKYGAPNEFDYNSNTSNNPDANAAVLRYNNENNEDGSYSYQFETENQIMQQQSGELRNLGTDSEALVVRGSYSYLGPDGIMYTVEYTADENGFHATGEHLPTPPPIPEAILKSLEENAAEEARLGGKYPASGDGYAYNKPNEYQESQGVSVDAASIRNQPQETVSRQYSSPNKQNFNQQQVYPDSDRGQAYSRPNGVITSGQRESQSESRRYQPPQVVSRQYLSPNKPNFNKQQGYQY